MAAGAAVELPLLAFLTKLGIRYQMFRHPAVLTVAAANEHMSGMPPGLHIKNLFLKDKKKQRRWVVSVPDDAKVDLKALGKTLGAAGNNLSFASDLTEVLGILPGSVTPLAVFNDQPLSGGGGLRVTSVLDRSLVASDAHTLVFVHPLHSEAPLGITSSDLVAVLHAVGHPPILIDVSLGGSSTGASSTGTSNYMSVDEMSTRWEWTHKY
jgi:Ala-tRNA(Pro) deacylase